MTKKLILFLLSALMLFSMSFALTACEKDGKDQEHTHEFATEWSYDDDYHWYKCTGEGCTEVKDKAEHAYVNGVCACGKQEPAPIHTHEFATEWTYDGNYHWHKCNGDGCTEIKDKAEHAYVNGVCTCGKKEPIVYSKADLAVDAMIFAGFPMIIDADAEIMYRETEEGLDFVVDAVALLLGAEYDAEIYYVDGVLAYGFSDGTGDMQYESHEIGTIAEIKAEALQDIQEDPMAKSVYDFVIDFMDKNDISIDFGGVSSLLYIEPNYQDEGSVDLAEDVQSVIDFLVENENTLIYDCVLQAIVESQEVPTEQQAEAIASIKKDVNDFLEKILDDDITIGEFIDGILDVIGLDLDSLNFLLDILQKSYQIETQDVIDVINEFEMNKLPDAKQDQTLTGYVLEQLDGLAVSFGKDSILEVKVCDFAKDVLEIEGFSLESALIKIKALLANTTFKVAIQELGIEAEEFFDTLEQISVEKLEFSYEVKANLLGLLSEITLGTKDAVTVGENTYSVNVGIVLSFEYGVTGEDVFVIPDIAE